MIQKRFQKNQKKEICDLIKSTLHITGTSLDAYIYININYSNKTYDELIKDIESVKNKLKDKLENTKCNNKKKLTLFFSYLFSKTTTYAGVYEIINTENKKKYIGESINIVGRIAEHVAELYTHTHHCIALQSDFNKTGSINNFQIHGVYVYPIEGMMREHEKEFTLYLEATYYLQEKLRNIKIYNTINPYEKLKEVNNIEVIEDMLRDPYEISNEKIKKYILKDLKETKPEIYQKFLLKAKKEIQKT